MSLDAFMKRGKPLPRKENDGQKIPKPTASPNIIEPKKVVILQKQPTLKGETNEIPKPIKIPFVKHYLKCPNPKCKYERTVMKAVLLRNDFTCPKCKTLMKERKHPKQTNRESDPEGDPDED